MDFTSPAPISLPSMVFNMLLGLALSTISAIFYSRYGNSLSNRSKFAPILPLLTLITSLIIVIIKSSLALSLGLVGALSIVRFRTAIKDPEELIYLFFSIAIGLGMGAEQRIPTLVSFGIIFAFLTGRLIIKRAFKISPKNVLYLNIEMPMKDSPKEAHNMISQSLRKELKSFDLRRMDTRKDQMHFVYYFRARSSDSLAIISDEIYKKEPRAIISIIEQNNLLGI